MSPHADQRLAGLGIPELDRLVRARRGDARAIGADGYAKGPPLIREKDVQASPARGIPDPQGPLGFSNRDDRSTVRVVREHIDWVAVPLERDLICPGLCVPC